MDEQGLDRPLECLVDGWKLALRCGRFIGRCSVCSLFFRGD